MHPDNNLPRLCARVLSRPTFLSLARGEDPKRVFKFLSRTDVATGSRTVAEVFERAFKVLRSSYRSEYVYKTAIANRIVFGRHSPRTSSLSVELHVGRSIIDVAVFNGTSTAYEVKTELDTPRRLITQTPDYLRAFDNVYVVTHPQLADRYAAICDEQVGILVLDKRESLKTVRRAQPNLANLDQKLLFRMLRRSEYQPALEQFLGQDISVPNGIVANHCAALFCELPIDTAHQIFLASMRARATISKENHFVSEIPAYLRVLAYAAGLSRPQRDRILNVLNLPIALA